VHVWRYIWAGVGWVTENCSTSPDGGPLHMWGLLVHDYMRNMSGNGGVSEEQSKKLANQQAGIWHCSSRISLVLFNDGLLNLVLCYCHGLFFNTVLRNYLASVNRDCSSAQAHRTRRAATGNWREGCGSLPCRGVCIM
jgi:hypothetical protein